MAFSVTPTSGAGTYYLSATFADDNYFGNGFRLEVRTLETVGSCPVDALSGTLATQLTTNLLATGTGTSATDVASGACRAYSASVVSDDNVIMQTETVFVDNVV